MSTKGVSFRYEPAGSVFDGCAATAFATQEKNIKYLLALLNSAYVAYIAPVLNPTLHFKLNDYAKIPLIVEDKQRSIISSYGLQDELTPDVADKDVTVHRVFTSRDDVPESMKGSNYVRTMRDEIVSLISYAVGCMFGRYSLDVEGLAYAGGEWDESRYKTFLPDEDNCIPVTDEEYFKDDKRSMKFSR